MEQDVEIREIIFKKIKSELYAKLMFKIQLIFSCIPDEEAVQLELLQLLKK